MQKDSKNKDITTPLHLIQEIVKILETKKCENISALNLNTVNTFLSYFVIASANTTTQARSVSREITRFMKGHRKMSSRQHSDMDSGWVLLDFDDILVHIMTPQTREFYDLDKLWGDAKPVKII